MKKTLLLFVTLCSNQIFAQVRLPQASPAAAISQTVGVTDLLIKYSRPSIKGREIFGKLLPYGKIWRTGANQATLFETSTDILVNGQKLLAGKYAILSLPEANEWTVIFSKNTTISEQSYKADEDALRIKAPVGATNVEEHFTISFSEITDSTTNLNFAWERTKVSIAIKTDVNAITEGNISKSVTENGNNLRAAADYLLSKNKNFDQAMKWTDASIAIKETFRNVWTKAQILAKTNQYTQALAFAKRSQELGANDPVYQFFKDSIEKGITEYSQQAMPLSPVIDNPSPKNPMQRKRKF